MTIARVHVAFKTHLDIGFTDLAQRVVQRYFEGYIPQAIALAQQMRDAGQPHRFVWTTGSWLIYEYLEHADANQRRAMERAIAAGDLVWHALPCTTHTELMDPGLIRHGLSLSKQLDQRFGKTTIAGKMTDVPGHTRAMVPYLAEAGVQFLHLGVNPASHPPAVPDLFRWQHTDGSEILVMYEKSDYGGVQNIERAGSALALAHTGDNCGPPAMPDILKGFEQLQHQFPDAAIFASTLDDFARDVLPLRSQFPVVTQEMGDTWIHGVGTDPLKISTFLELCRQRRYSRPLMLVAEHTWGRDIKAMLTDPELFETYEKTQFQRRRARGDFKLWEDSWQEQRDYIGVPRAPHKPVATSVASFSPTSNRTRPSPVPLPPALARLQPVLLYEVFGSEDYDRFTTQYNPNLTKTRFWAIPDFGKPGLEKVLQRGQRWHASAIHVQEQGDSTLVTFAFPEEPIRLFGCPARFELRVQGPRWELTWHDKDASRIPEAIWLGLNPPGLDESFRLIKLGQEIDPLHVVEFGARSLHAVTALKTGAFQLRTLDAPLVAVGQPALLNFNNQLPDLRDGFHFNLYNNVWGTNFPLWYDQHARFRFEWS